jgi:hypothetical protein
MDAMIWRIIGMKGFKNSSAKLVIGTSANNWLSMRRGFGLESSDIKFPVMSETREDSEQLMQK